MKYGVFTNSIKTKIEAMSKKIILIAMVFVTGTMFAQQPVQPQPNLSPKERKAKMEAMKVGFITQKLDLTPAEAEKFWPVYNEFGQKREDLRKKMMGDKKNEKMNIDSMDDKEAGALVDNELAFHEQMIGLQKEYVTKFKTVLPVKKVAKLYEAEKEFRMKMGQRMMRKQNKMKQGQGQRPPHQAPQGGK